MTDTNEHEVVKPEKVSEKNLVWTPDDAAHFVSTAIQEVQRPLTDVLKRRTISPVMLLSVIVALLFCFSLAFWLVMGKLEKTEVALENSRQSRDAAIANMHEANSKHTGLSLQLDLAADHLKKVEKEYTKEVERLLTETSSLRQNDDELKKIRIDLARYRRQTELLRSQIQGLELEKEALNKQLVATKALLAADDDLNTDSDVFYATEAVNTSSNIKDSNNAVPNAKVNIPAEVVKENDKNISTNNPVPVSSETAIGTVSFESATDVESSQNNTEIAGSESTSETTIEATTDNNNYVKEDKEKIDPATE